MHSFEQTYYPVMMRTVEHWWNGSWGSMTRRDVRLQVDDGQWRVLVSTPKGAEVAIVYHSREDLARNELELLLSERGPWRPLS